jgi:hypothetical protein
MPQVQSEEDLKRILKGPNAYKMNPRSGQMEYVTEFPTDTEYPRAMFRKPTEQEVQDRRDNLPKEVWLDRETNLIELTGLNLPKKVEAWKAYIERPVEHIVHNAKQEKALGSEWTRNYSDVK